MYIYNYIYIYIHIHTQVSSYESEEEEIVLTEEQQIEKQLDDRNITIEVLVPGDGQNFPMIGDIVRVRYVCYLVETNKVYIYVYLSILCKYIYMCMYICIFEYCM